MGHNGREGNRRAKSSCHTLTLAYRANIPSVIVISHVVRDSQESEDKRRMKWAHSDYFKTLTQIEQTTVLRFVKINPRRSQVTKILTDKKTFSAPAHGIRGPNCVHLIPQCAAMLKREYRIFQDCQSATELITSAKEFKVERHGFLVQLDKMQILQLVQSITSRARQLFVLIFYMPTRRHYIRI